MNLLPFWHEAPAPALGQGQKILVAAHISSLQALVKYLDDIPDDAISGLNIPAGVPLVYELAGDPKPQKNYYLE